MLENNLAKTPGSRAAIDPSPLRVNAEESLERVVLALAKAAKTYALVYQKAILMGVFSYDNVAQAAAHQVDFSQVPVRLWMTALDSLHPLPTDLVRPLNADLLHPGQTYLPVVDQTHHWLGLLAEDGLYVLGHALVSQSTTQAQLTACQVSSELLQQQQDHLALALKGAQMGTWNWDLIQGTIVISDEQERLLGLAPGEFDGSYDTLFTNLYADDQTQVHQALQQSIQRGQRYEIEFRILHPDGRIRWLSASGQVFDNGKQPPRLAGVTLDISDRKQADAKIQSQSRRERLVGEISQRIRHLLDLDSILEQTVTSVREFIDADRVIVIQCGPEMSGEVIQEACAPPYLSMLGAIHGRWERPS